MNGEKSHDLVTMINDKSSPFKMTKLHNITKAYNFKSKAVRHSDPSPSFVPSMP